MGLSERTLKISESGTCTATVVGSAIDLDSTVEEAYVEVENTGAVNALSDFTLEAQAYTGGVWVELEGTWTTATVYLKAVPVTQPKTLATSGTSHIHLFGLRGISSIRFVATSVTTTVSINGKGVSA